MRWLAVILVELLCSAVGAAIAAAWFFSSEPSGTNGLIGAMFALPFLIIGGAVAGALVGVLPAVLVSRTMAQRSRNT